MPSRRTTLVRTVTVGCAVAGAAAIGAGPANALPVQQPAFTHHDFRVNTFAGTPIPLGAAVVEIDAATNGTGVVRFTVGRRCASEGGRPCGYSVDMSVQWINFANGATGTTAVGRSTPKFVTTGRGPVGLSFSVPRTLSLPSVGLVNS
ncbi:hypothetical protein [Williamsia phyllosphaerae]|uniref:Secreted protein n=1 Tax=Williamsia phyllosphaerae TaxID=885042 RepID=A0ABQ1UAW0_9NOCA|nr:hypothetical protein [Williamsia phyllosphaerae]GGF12597.1 hypothetical protein GCM10007298_05630 [Williamsia phyllosphaerae]